MPGKKEMLANLLFSNPVFEKAAMLRPLRNLSILAYHRVTPLAGEDYPFVRGVISCDADMFDRQLEFVKRHFRVINFRDLAEIHEAGEPLPPNSLILTFDDGYADNYTNMLPVLESHGLTAVVFLATRYIDTGELFWVDKLAYAVNRMPEGQLRLLGGEEIFEVRDETREAVRQAVGRLCAQQDFTSHFEIMREIEAQVGIEPDASEYELARPMTWDEVSALAQAGVEIGAHTVTHGFLDRMTEAEVETELRDSKAAIDSRLDQEAITVCYPAGKYTDTVLRLAVECGYRYGCAYRHGSEVYSDRIRYQIPRIHVDHDVNFPLFKANLSLPRLFLR